ncbi:MAG TPA: hypothetical protein VI299_14140 [Polyangiales bacterium]
MAHIHTLQSTALGAALAALAAVASLWIAGGSDAPTLGLSELQRTESVLMSCADATPVSAGLMWCADPDSPQCIPALPQPPRPELWDRVDAALPQVAGLPRTGYAWMTWPTPVLVDLPGRTPSQRLERPPRA